MAIQITIEGVDRTRSVEWDSLVIEIKLNSQPDSAQFRVFRRTQGYAPSVGEEVVVTLDGTKRFGGHILRVNEVAPEIGQREYDVECVGYEQRLVRKLVDKAYEDVTVLEIIQDLHTNYFPSGFTITNAQGMLEIDKIVFNYVPLNEALSRLAELVNYDWYVDYDKDLHFFPKEENLAPVTVQDDNGSYIYRTLKIRRDNSQVRTTIIIRGGTFLGNTLSADYEADGTERIFTLPYKLSEFQATLTGKILNIGIDPVDDPDSFDALHNFQEKRLIFKDADKPSVGSTGVVSGKPNLPLIVRYSAMAEISTLSVQDGSDGSAEHIIVDSTIETKEAARARARAEVVAYGETLSEGEFETETDGFFAGQRVTINSTSRGVSNEQFIINRVTARMWGPNQMRYRISMVTTRTFEMIDLLRKLTLQEGQRLDLDESETVDRVTAFTENQTMAETFTAQSLNYKVGFGLGSFAPTGLVRSFRLGWSRLSS